MRVLVVQGTVAPLRTAGPSRPIPEGVRREAEGRVLRGIGVHAGPGLGGGEINIVLLMLWQSLAALGGCGPT